MAIENAKPCATCLDEIFQLAESLSVEDKAKLIELLLGKQSGLNVVLGRNHLSGQIVELINVVSQDELSEILKAIANRLATEGK